MPNEYGDITVGDLQGVIDHVSDVVANIADDNSDMRRLIASKILIPSLVLEILDGDDADYYGPGSIKVRKLGDAGNFDAIALAKPCNLIRGRFDVPKEKSWVYIFRPYPNSDVYEYFGEYQFTEGSGFNDSIQDLIEPDSGFVDAVPPYKYGGKRLKDAVDNPDEQKIFESTKNFVFGLDEDKKQIDLSVDDGWSILLKAGNNGKIRIVAEDPITEEEGLTTNIDVEFVTGHSGTFTIDSGGKIKIGSDDGVEIKAGVDSLEKMVLGETLKGLLEGLIDAITALTVPTAVGPSGTPINAADFMQIKADLANMLSDKNKNN